MKRPPLSLRAQLIIAALAQTAAVVLIAVVIGTIYKANRPTPPRRGPPPVLETNAGMEEPGARAERPPRAGRARRRGRPTVPLPLQLTLAGVLGVLLIGGAATARSLLPPLKELRRGARALERGEFATRVKVLRGDEIGEVAEAFNEMAAHVEQTLQSERALVAAISHELRTPLSRIRLAVEIAEEDDESALIGVRDDLTEIEALLDDIFAASRLQAATSTTDAVFASDTRTTSVTPIIEHAVRRFRARYPDCNVAVQDDTHGVQIQANVVLLRRAIENLLENAAKYAGASAYVRVVARTATDGGATNVTIDVIDDGNGVPESLLSRLSEPFVRAPGTGREGIGLGLFLVQRIAQAHGGGFELANSTQGGARARLRVPATEL